MASVAEVPLDWYLDNILPPLPIEANIDSLMESLRRSSVITSDLDDESPGTWLAFSDCEPEKLFEVDILERLCIVFDAIVGATKQQMERVSHSGFQNAVSLQMVSDENEAVNTSKPLAYFLLNNEASYGAEEGAEENHPWYQIINPCFALQPHDVEKNDMEILNQLDDPNDNFVLGAMQNILSKDPCRRFTFGTSINGRRAILWFSNHGFSLKSESFDLFKDHRQLIHLFVSLAFARRSIDLGWDPSLARVRYNPEDKQWRYLIRVDGQTFTTVSVLADYTAHAGRWTRVWLVKDCHGNLRVLKDVWVDDRRQAEHEILEEMLQDVRKACGDEDCEVLKNLLLTPVAFEKVCVDGKVDSTALLQGCKSLLNTLENADTLVEACQRFHYRIVFLEYATPIKDERWLGNVFDTLADAVGALEIIHRAGWVHRDISGGNVYSYVSAESHRGLIGDFEFAKREDQEEPRRIVGTPETIASEAAVWAWLFRPRLPTTGDTVFKFRFRYLFLHDLESIFWILVQVLFFNENTASIVYNTTSFLQRAAMSERLFPSKVDIFSDGLEHICHRSMFLKDPLRFNNYNNGLSRTFDPVKSVVSQIADLLVARYRHIEGSPESLRVSGPNNCEIHEEIQGILDDNRSVIASIRLGQGVRVRKYGVVQIHRQEPHRRATEHGCPANAENILHSNSMAIKKRKCRSDELERSNECGSRVRVTPNPLVG